MNETELREAVIDVLAGIAPEVDAADIDSRMPLREQYDIDSVDFLNFVVALHKRLGIDIAESDYVELSTLESSTRYLAAKLADTGG